MQTTVRTIASFTLVLLGTASARADVFVVDPSGQGDFTQINQAVSAAVDGDLILVKSGTYAPFFVPDRAVSVVADEGARVTIDGYAAVIDLKAGRTVLFSGINATSQAPESPGLYLFNNAGSVRIQDGSFTGYTPPDDTATGFNTQAPGGIGVYVEDCADVAVIDSELNGGTGGSAESALSLTISGKGGNALRVIDSKLALYNSTTAGGNGGIAGYAGGGGNGLTATQGSRVFISGGSVAGGNGGLNNDVIPICEPGGDGIFAADSARVKLLDVDVIAGPPAHPPFFNCDPGQVTSGLGTFVTLSETARETTVAAVVRENESVDLSFQGVSGDLVYLPIAHAPDHASFPLPFVGKWMIHFPPMWTVAALGTADGAGSLDVGYHAGNLTSIPYRIVHTQGLFTTTNELCVIGNPRLIVVLDDQF